VIVDSHCHASTRWYQPVESLLFEMDRHGVDRAVLVQLLGAFDNRDMIAAVRAHPDRFVFVAALAPDRMNRRGVCAARGEGAAGLRLRGCAPAEVWQAAAEMGLAVSVAGPAASFVDGAIARVAEAHPGLVIVLEHLGGLARPDTGDRAATLVPLLALARFANIQIKLPGLGQLAPRLPRIDGEAMPLDMAGVGSIVGSVVEAFTPDRMMWGSDYPPVAAREGYGHALGWPRALLEPLGASACAALFGGTAARSFGLAG